MPSFNTCLKTIFFIVITILVISIGVVTGLLAGYLKHLPQIESLENYEPSVVTMIYGDNNEVIAELYQEKRILVNLAQIPDYLKKAIVAVEDNRFYSHWGVDFKGVLRAIWADIKERRAAQGASTITQQLAKVLFLTSEKSIERKVKEALLAVQIEKRYTKDEILELYLNQVYLGSGAYGVETAAMTYFGKHAKDLGLVECAMLAGLPQRPNTYSPLNNPELARKRLAVVLKRMAEIGYISEEQFNTALNAPLQLVASSSLEKNTAPYFVDLIRSYIEESAFYGYNAIYKKGLAIYTTLNKDLQLAANQSVSEGLFELNKRHKYEFPLEGALLAIESSTGQIKAMVGGADHNLSKYNKAVQAKRQPGSVFKPFVYASALENGLRTIDVITDEPVTYIDPKTKVEWSPENYEGDYHGPTFLREALVHSRNVVTVKLLDKVGINTVIDLAHRMGINSYLNPYLSLALGASEVSLLEVTSAYSAFANKGIRVEPSYIRYIADTKGTVLEKNFSVASRAVTPEVAYIVTSMLKDVIDRGTGVRAKSLGRYLAGKTGTTSNYTDAWFVGYSPELVAGVWVGFDQTISLGKGETGASAALPIWIKFMGQALIDRPNEDFEVPAGITFQDIDKDTGSLAIPESKTIIREVFIKGTEPTEYVLPTDIK
ncbi:MAG: PBP1A family penicillin-binding protein [bacterium]